MMPNQKEEAEELVMGLRAGYSTVAEAVAWADRVIVADLKPDIEVIEVSLASHVKVDDMIGLLREVRGTVDPTVVMRKWMARMLKDLNADPGRGDDIARWLYQLANYHELPEEPFGYEPYALDDAFDLARSGVCGTHEEAVTRLREYLEEHALRGAE